MQFYESNVFWTVACKQYCKSIGDAIGEASIPCFPQTLPVLASTATKSGVGGGGGGKGNENYKII